MYTLSTNTLSIISTMELIADDYLLDDTQIPFKNSYISMNPHILAS